MKGFFRSAPLLTWLIGLFLLSFTTPPLQLVGLAIFLASVVYAFVEPGRRKKINHNSESRDVADSPTITISAIGDMEDAEITLGGALSYVMTAANMQAHPQEQGRIIVSDATVASFFRVSDSTASHRRPQVRPRVLAGVALQYLNPVAEDNWTVARAQDAADRRAPIVPNVAAERHH